MKNRLSLLCLAGILALGALGLAGCSKDQPAPAPSEEGETAAKEYVIFSDNAFAPFEFLDTQSNAYIGLDMDLMAAIAKDQNFTYTMKNEGFDPAMTAVQSGQAQGMIAGMTITDERKQTFDFSESYFEDGQVLVVEKNSEIAKVDDLKGKTVAAKIGTMGTKYAESIKDQYGFTVQYYEDSPTMYTAVVQGNNAACFEDRSVVEWAIKQESLGLKTVGDVVNPKPYGFAVKKGENADLIKLFNDGLANIKASGEYEKILAKYGF